MTTPTIPNYPLIIARQIKSIRAINGMTQLDLAERTGLFRTYVSRIEQGKANPTIIALAALAGALEVDVRELLSDKRND